MRKKIFYVAAAVAMLSACEGKEAVEQIPDEREKVSLEVVMSSSETTKVSGIGGDEEKAVASYQVLVYDMSSRMLEAFATPKPTDSSVEMECTTGPKEIIVLANAPDVSSKVSYDAFVATSSYLKDNAVGSLVMEGHASCDITSAMSTVTVNIRRIVSKVVLEKVEVDFESDVYDDMDFILKSAYLTNVAAEKKYLAKEETPALWYNQIVRSDATEVDDLVFGDLEDTELENPSEYTDKHHFYCYPNPCDEDSFSSEWSPRPTRLVVEAELGGELYYYPVALPPLQQNTKYHVSLRIVRPGATSPEQDMDKSDASFTITIEEWEESKGITETI